MKLKIIKLEGWLAGGMEERNAVLYYGGTTHRA